MKVKLVLFLWTSIASSLHFLQSCFYIIHTYTLHHFNFMALYNRSTLNSDNGRYSTLSINWSTIYYVRMLVSLRGSN